jgi:hypothetical protein
MHCRIRAFFVPPPHSSVASFEHVTLRRGASFNIAPIDDVLVAIERYGAKLPGSGTGPSADAAIVQRLLAVFAEVE